MSAPHIDIIDGKCPHGSDVYSTRCTACERFVQSYEEAEKVVDQLSKLVNGAGSLDALATAFANEHPTLLGQMAKAMAMGVVRRADYNPGWKPYDGFTRPLCTLPEPPSAGDGWEPHPEHDGRLSCALVAGAVVSAQQYYV